jgi:hypothetical protein
MINAPTRSMHVQIHMYDRTPFTLYLDLWNASWQRTVICFSFQLTRELITFQFNPICFAIHKDILFPIIGLLSRCTVPTVILRLPYEGRLMKKGD